MNKQLASCLLTVLVCACAQAAEEGLVAHYAFDAGSGEVARDTSGQNNHGSIKGGATFVKRGEGFALKLDGRDDFVDCGADPSLAIESAGTIEIWFRAEELQGGLVNWSTGSGWNDERLVLAFATHTGSSYMLATTADGALFSQFWLDVPDKSVWHHYAMVFDGSGFLVYRDGVLHRTFLQGVKPAIRGVPFWIGKCLGLGKHCFKGLIDEVRVYDRPLRPEEVAVHYKQHAESLGKETVLFERPSLRPQPIPEPGWVAALVSYGLMQPLPKNATLQATLHRPGDATVLDRRKTTIEPGSHDATLILKAGRLPAGKYEIRATIEDADGTPVGQAAKSSVTWPSQPEAFKKVEILNNFVWELLNAEPGRFAGKKSYTFTNPTDRWVYLQVIAEADAPRASLDSLPLLFDPKYRKPGEAMRFLSAGEHTVVLDSDGEVNVKKLAIRSIAELVFQHGYNPHVKAFGPYVPDFARQHVLPHANTLVKSRRAMAGPFPDEWTRHGGRILLHCNPVTGTKDKPLTVDLAADFVAKTAGYQSPLAAGSIADEFGGSSPRCAFYARAIRKLHATDRFQQKVFYPYAGNLYNGPEGRQFTRALIDTGGANVWKRYLPEAPTEELARRFLESVLIDTAREFRKHCPGSIAHLVPCIGYFSAPPEFCDVNPSVDYRVYLDMQFHTIATDPAFFGTRGVMTYGVSYTDEEIVRLSGRLFRRYGIEGATDRAVGDPYRLDHLDNPDFADGARGWRLKPAREDSIRTVRRVGFGFHQGRYLLGRRLSQTEPASLSFIVCGVTPPLPRPLDPAPLFS